MPNEYFKSAQHFLAVRKNEIPVSLQSDRLSSRKQTIRGCSSVTWPYQWDARSSISRGRMLARIQDSYSSLVLLHTPGAAPYARCCCGSPCGDSSETEPKTTIWPCCWLNSRGLQITYHRDTSTFMVVAVLFPMANKRKQPGWPSTDDNVRCTVAFYASVNVQENGGRWISC